MSEPHSEEAKLKGRKRRREPMPAALKERARAGGPVDKQHGARYPAPPVDVSATDKGWTFENPYRSADEDEWWRLLGEACGSRTKAVIAVFMGQVASLVSTEWDEATGKHIPCEEELRAALSIIAALKPRNEAEAAQAAQAFALHRFTMKLGGEYANRSFVDPRALSAMANLVKAYTGVMDSMRRGRRKSTTRQVIRVEKHVTINQDNRSVTLRGGGRAADNPRDAAEGTTRAGGSEYDTPCNGAGTGVLIEGTALLGPPQDGGTVPSACCEGSFDLQNALGPQANGAERRSKSELSARKRHSGSDSDP